MTRRRAFAGLASSTRVRRKADTLDFSARALARIVRASSGETLKVRVGMRITVLRARGRSRPRAGWKRWRQNGRQRRSFHAQPESHGLAEHFAGRCGDDELDRVRAKRGVGRPIVRGVAADHELRGAFDEAEAQRFSATGDAHRAGVFGAQPGAGVGTDQSDSDIAARCASSAATSAMRSVSTWSVLLGIPQVCPKYNQANLSGQSEMEGFRPPFRHSEPEGSTDLKL